MGVVSTTDRVLDEEGSIGRFNTWIQTDAAINPGNSGGPLIDLNGRIIGINARGILGSAENLGFAIPGNLAHEIAEELIAQGRVDRSTLGLSFQSIESVRGLGPAAQDARGRGAIVSAIDAGGPAAQAGVRVGDMLVALNGAKVDGRYDELIPALRKRISDIAVGETVKLSLLRHGAQMTVDAISRPLDSYFADEFQAEDWGLTMKAVTETVRLRWRLDDLTGAIVASAAPGKPGYTAGLRSNDVVYVFDKTAVRNLDHFKELYAAAVQEKREAVMLQVRNGSFYRFVLVKPTYEKDEEPATGETSGADETPATGDDSEGTQ